MRLGSDSRSTRVQRLIFASQSQKLGSKLPSSDATLSRSGRCGHGQVGLIPVFVTPVLFWLGCRGSSSSTGGGGGGGGGGASITTPPAQPIDSSPIKGEVSYIVNQRSGLEADPNSGLAGDHVVIQMRCFTNLSQRWALTALSAGKRKVSNLSSGLCLDSTSGNPIVQATANSSQEQEWDVVSAVLTVISISSIA